MYIVNIESGTVLRVSDGATIPMDINNADYIEYLKWAKKNGQTS